MRRQTPFKSAMQKVDKLLAKRYAIWKKKGQAVPQAQVALVAHGPAHRAKFARWSAGGIMARAS